MGQKTNARVRIKGDIYMGNDSPLRLYNRTKINLLYLSNTPFTIEVSPLDGQWCALTPRTSQVFKLLKDFENDKILISLRKYELAKRAVQEMIEEAKAALRKEKDSLCEINLT